MFLFMPRMFMTSARVSQACHVEVRPRHLHMMTTSLLRTAATVSPHRSHKGCVLRADAALSGPLPMGLQVPYPPSAALRRFAFCTPITAVVRLLILILVLTPHHHVVLVGSDERKFQAPSTWPRDDAAVRKSQFPTTNSRWCGLGRALCVAELLKISCATPYRTVL